MKKRGIVVKKTPNGQVIVLTKEGEFIEVTPEYAGDIGEEVPFIYANRKEQVRGISNMLPFLYKRKFIASVAIIFLLFFVGLQGWVGSPFEAKKVAAYVSMDINPSVEMGISSDQIVLEATGLNPDGIALIDDLKNSIIKQPIDKATTIIMDEIIKKQYIKGNSEVVIAITKLDKNEKLDYEIEQKIKNTVADKVKELPQVHITSFQTTEEDREEAQVNQLSSGKYAIYKMAQDKGYEMPIDQLKDRSIQEMMKEYQEMERSSQDKVMQNEKNVQNKLNPKSDKDQIGKPEDEKEKTPMNMGEQKKRVQENNDNSYEKVKQNNKENVYGNEKDNEKDNEKSNGKEKISEDEDNEIGKFIKKDLDKEDEDENDSDLPKEGNENKNNGNGKRIKNEHD